MYRAKLKIASKHKFTILDTQREEEAAFRRTGRSQKWVISYL